MVVWYDDTFCRVHKVPTFVTECPYGQTLESLSLPNVCCLEHDLWIEITDIWLRALYFKQFIWEIHYKIREIQDFFTLNLAPFLTSLCDLALLLTFHFTSHTSKVLHLFIFILIHLLVPSNTISHFLFLKFFPPWFPRCQLVFLQLFGLLLVCLLFRLILFSDH